MNFSKLKKIMVREYEKSHSENDENRINMIDSWCVEICFKCDSIQKRDEYNRRIVAVDFPDDLRNLISKNNITLKSYSFCKDCLEAFVKEINSLTS